MSVDIESLTYREARPDDVPALLALWEKASGWGPLTAEKWRSWYVDAPRGPALVVVAENADGLLVGQIVWTPCRMWVDGRECTGLRTSAPILDTDVRPQSTLGGRHPVLELYGTGIALAEKRGFALVYALPDRRWIRFLERSVAFVSFIPRLRGGHACVARQCRATRSPPAAMRVTEVNAFGSDFERMWVQGRDAYPVRTLVGRDPAWLRYKNGGHLTLEVRTARGVLAGYVALDVRKGSLVDHFAESPDDLVDVLNGAVGWLAAAAKSSERLAHLASVSALAVPATAAALAAAGFAPVEYEFGFFADTLDERVALEALTPDAWFLTAGD